MVTVFTKDNCAPCMFTKRLLTDKGLEFIEEPVDKNPEALARIKELGYLQVPVVLTSEGEHWSGLRPDLIKNLK